MPFAGLALRQGSRDKAVIPRQAAPGAVSAWPACGVLGAARLAHRPGLLHSLRFLGSLIFTLLPTLAHLLHDALPLTAQGKVDRRRWQHQLVIDIAISQKVTTPPLCKRQDSFG